jgi:hypothetical protein
MVGLPDAGVVGDVAIGIARNDSQRTNTRHQLGRIR